MEEEYKLQEIQTKDIFTNKKVRYVLFAIWVIGVIILLIFSVNTTKSTRIILLIIAFGYSCIFGILALAIWASPKNNKDYKYIKDIGKKETAYIVDTGYSRHRGFLASYQVYNRGFRTLYRLYYITIVYKDKVKNIYKLQNNVAYKILKLILNSHKYPVERVAKIPVDIYVYKNKIYVDFESVKLSTLDGYEEAKKL